MSKYPSIPDPQATIESLTTSVRVLKQVVEMLVGLRGGKGAARVFIQDTQPVPENPGDIWITPKGNYRIQVWTGHQWALATT